MLCGWGGGGDAAGRGWLDGKTAAVVCGYELGDCEWHGYAKRTTVMVCLVFAFARGAAEQAKGMAGGYLNLWLAETRVQAVRTRSCGRTGRAGRILV